MKILLVEPPFARLKQDLRVFFPLGLGYLASSLEQAGFMVRIYNAEIPDGGAGQEVSASSASKRLGQHKFYAEALSNPHHSVWREIKGVIESFRPDVLGITARSPKFPAAMRIAAIAKEVNRQCHVVIGGPHPTIQQKEVIENEHVDSVAVGEGEMTLVELCHALEAGKTLKQVSGLVWKEGGKVTSNSPRQLIRDLDALPFPGRRLVFRPESYTGDTFGVVVTSRGCPFQCGYCSASSMWTRKVRYRSVENVIAEIRLIVEEFGISTIFFWDDSMTVNRKRLIQLCQALIKERLGVKWQCTTRVDLVDDELLRHMKRAGCVHIDVGIESGSPRILRSINKGITIEQVERAVKLIKMNRIAVSAFFMIGFPEETAEDIRQTIELIDRLKISTCFSVFTPYPGTALFNQAKSFGLVPEQIEWEKHDHQSPENFFVKDMDRKLFDQLEHEMARISDMHNNSLMRHVEYAIAASGFYVRNPRRFSRVVGLAIRRCLPGL
jgi:anaerobic magnesium-protoporphyrin IX monomethyl ester cyclase